jgi:hypothetical protein
MLGVQGRLGLVEQVTRIGGEALGSTDFQSFCKIDAQFRVLVLKLVPLGILRRTISKWGESSLSNFS